MSEDTNADHFKMCWLSPAMSGSDKDVIAQLFNTLPNTEGLNASQLTQLEQARLVMSELWLRGIDLNHFCQETGLTGAPKDLMPAGFSRQQVFGSPTYFKVLLSEKNATTCADGLKKLLIGRKQSAGEYAEQYRMLFYLDIDSDNKESPFPYQCGLTPRAICFDQNLAEVENSFAAIDEAASAIIEHSINNVRIGIGQFGPDEYFDIRGRSLYTKRMMFNMGGEWLLFKNICRRAGKMGWFWRFIARRYDRYDNP